VSGSRRAGWAALALVAALVVALDQATKALARARIEPGERIEVLPFLDLVHVSNEGVAFGFLGGASTALVIAVMVVALAAVLGWFASDPARRWAALAVGLLVGGAAGNLIDRLHQDAVTDFIDLPAWPSFNLADVAITLGAVLLVLSAFVGEDGEEPEGERA
jgi:signal peptidase II